MKKSKHRGLQQYRYKDNPEEKRISDAWVTKNEYGNVLAYLLHIGDQHGKPPDPSNRDVEVAATVIQWLGSPMGQHWLMELGYAKTT